MNLKDNESREQLIFLAIMTLIISTFSAVYFGFTGLRVFGGVLLVSAPFYLLLNNFNINEGEKFVLSAILGLTLFSSLVYMLGFLISFRMSIVVSFILLTGISLLLKYKILKSKQKN